MVANVSCIACIIDKQEKGIRSFTDEKKNQNICMRCCGYYMSMGRLIPARGFL